MQSVEVTYLQMFQPPVRSAGSMPSGVSIAHVAVPSVEMYRSLYDRVGRDWRWHDRKRLSDSDLAVIIQHANVDIHVVHVEGVQAGYAELDRRIPGETEIAYFGLMPDYIGRGIGRWFLDRTIDMAWTSKPRRVWLHTCTLDHPRALPNYIRAGFTPYKHERVEISP